MTRDALFRTGAGLALAGATAVLVAQPESRLRPAMSPSGNAQRQFNVASDGRIPSVNNQFLPNVTAAVASLLPRLGAVAGVGRAAEQLGLRDVPARVLRTEAGARRTTRLEAPGLKSDEMTAGLVILPVRRGMARLAWNFQVWLPGQPPRSTTRRCGGHWRAWPRVEGRLADMTL